MTTTRTAEPAPFHAPLAVLTCMLIAIGVVMASSATMDLSPDASSQHWWDTQSGRQVILAGTALATMAMMSLVGRLWFSAAPASRFFVAAAIFSLAVVGLAAVWLTPLGLERNGAARWLRLPIGSGFALQPSELAKPALMLMLGSLLGGSLKRTQSFFGGFVPACGVIGLLAGLVAVEDFGTGALLGVVGLITLFAAGCRIWHLLLAAVPGVLGLAYLVVSEPYRMKRLTSFMDIYADTRGAGYHAIQSLTSIVSGGWFGRGLGTGIQKYGFLPEAESDFIFAIICEETGVVGGAAIILIFVALAWVGLRVAQRAPTATGRVVAICGTLLIVVQAVINVAVATVAAPTKGIPLPFISAGGSGLLCLSACVGLMLAVGRAEESEEVVALAPCSDPPPASGQLVLDLDR